MVDAAALLGAEARDVLRAEFGDAPVRPGNHAAMLLDSTVCIRCGLCALRCPTDAVVMHSAEFRVAYEETERRVQWSTA